MRAVFEVIEIVDKPAWGPVLSGRLKKGQLRPGMESFFQDSLLKLKDIYDQAEELQAVAVAGQNLYLAVTVTHLEILKATAGNQLVFEDQEHRLKRQWQLKPTVA